jgi:hypothetical protein
MQTGGMPDHNHERQGPMLERLKAEISLLVTQMENQPDDKHEVYLQLREKLNEMRVTGMPLPEDLLQLERRLEAEFNAAK